MAALSPPVVLLSMSDGLKLILHVNVTPLSVEFSCIVSDEATVFDVLVGL